MVLEGTQLIDDDYQVKHRKSESLIIAILTVATLESE